MPPFFCGTHFALVISVWTDTYFLVAVSFSFVCCSSIACSSAICFSVSSSASACLLPVRSSLSISFVRLLMLPPGCVLCFVNWYIIPYLFLFVKA